MGQKLKYILLIVGIIVLGLFPLLFPGVYYYNSYDYKVEDYYPRLRSCSY